MQETQQELQVLKHTYVEVERRFMGCHDLAHGWEHVGRVYKLARYIGEREQADNFVVGMAALMHDLGRTIPHRDTAEHHAHISVRQARELTNSYAVAEEKQEAILHAITAHSFSLGLEPRTLEARVVRDADRLDGLGAIGIMRWAITGAVRQTAQTLSYHPTDPFAVEHEPDDHIYMLDHFYAKLLKLGETMATETGRLIAGRRIEYMRKYLDELRHELELVEL